MPDVTNGTTRTQLSELIKGVSMFGQEAGVDYVYTSIDVKGSGDIDNIGIPLIWNATTSAFNVFVANVDWEASTTYALGDVVKPITQNGLEYVCVTAGDSDAAEPTWPTTPGMTETETAGAVWFTRIAYTGADSSLPTKANICVLVGAKEGKGFNVIDTTLSATAISMPVLFRGESAVAEEGFTWGAVAAADQAEFYTAFEINGIRVIDAGTTVDPSFI